MTYVSKVDELVLLRTSCLSGLFPSCFTTNMSNAFLILLKRATCSVHLILLTELYQKNRNSLSLVSRSLQDRLMKRSYIFLALYYVLLKICYGVEGDSVRYRRTNLVCCRNAYYYYSIKIFIRPTLRNA
jgi:hypothetical protein